MSRDIGQYKIFNEIGKGSFGKVFKGIDKLTGQEIALKFIQKKQRRSRDLRNLREENQLLKKINHPNVISLKDVIQTEKQIIIVTDYAGRDLSGLIEDLKKFPLEKVKDYSTQILNAMLYLNENRIIHRDLKPQNILIKNNRIKICDFGFAKKLSASTNFLQSMKGTPLYLAPEIVRQTRYTEKVDIWSFGCIIYELFTGRTPYYANTFQKLAPLILYQQVQYPQDMPAELKDLISSMLQKNPSARPNWKQLKEHSFFKQPQVLRQRFDNIMKEVVSYEFTQHHTGTEKASDNKQNEKACLIHESKVIQKFDNEQQIKGYLDEFKKIYSELVTNANDGSEIRRDVIFLHKIKTVFHERSQQNILITNELLEVIFNILTQLIKIKRSFSTGQRQNENLTAEEDDITKNEALIIGILCLAKVEKNYEMLEKQLKIICLLIKRNFNGVAINTDIDEEITEFITEILLENAHKMPIECIRNGLIIIGTLVNQALMTINNSSIYFQRIAEDNLLGKIANIFKKQEQRAIVLECLKQFIHPIREVPSMNGNHPHYILQARMMKVFQTLREQACEGLLKTDFISEKSALQVYGQKSSHIVDYCEVLLQCLISSREMRKQFLKHSYWPSLLSIKKTRAFLFAYNQIFINYDSQSIIPKQIMATFTKQSQQNKLINIFIVEMGYDNLKKKMTKMVDRQVSNNVMQFEKSILQKISQFLFIEQATKSKSTQEIYGTLHTTTAKFDQPMITMFYQIVEAMKISQTIEENKQLAQSIFKRICNTTAPFKPNAKSLLNLITLYTESEVMRQLKSQKTIQMFFYECISDYLKREDFEYLEIDFHQKEISQFVMKIIKCLNYLIEVEEPGSKGPGSLSQFAIGLSKQIQSSSFYRFMFIDGLTEEQFYQHLKYSQKIITKTSQVAVQFTNFLGVKVIPMCKNYIMTKSQPLIVEMCILLSQLARDHTQFNNEILSIKIISRFREWLIDQSYSEAVKEKTLYLIGNLAKRSQFFFSEFQSAKTLDGVAICLEKHYTNTKIFKNTIYSVGNISFYSQRFYKQIEPMISYFAKAFELKDPHLQNNLISTVSNLMRFSNIYLSGLIKTGMMGHILRMACEAREIDQVTGNLFLSLLKKVLPYEQFYRQFGYKELRMIYQRRQLFGGDGNQTIRKIKDILVKSGNQV